MQNGTSNTSTTNSSTNIRNSNNIKKNNASEEQEDQVLVKPEELHAFCMRCMEKVGAPPHHVHVWAELLVSADVRGHYSHGMRRLDNYLREVVAGHIKVDKEPEVVKQTDSTALVNGNSCLGSVVGQFCIDLAIEKAKKSGIGWVCAYESNHFGIAGWYSLRAMQQGMIGLAFCNTCPGITPNRGTKRTLGTNPLSVAAKGENGDEFVLDMATSSVAQGKIDIKRLRGESMPSGWGVDRNGKMTTNCEEVLLNGGGLCPLGGAEETGGYKGFGLAFMVELFCGILSGSRFGTQIRSWVPDGFDTEANFGQCYVAIDPKAFAPGFEGRLSELIQQCKDCPKVDGETEILIPGDPERKHIALSEKLGGIPYHPTQVEYADSVAVKYGVAPLVRYKNEPLAPTSI